MADHDQVKSKLIRLSTEKIESLHIELHAAIGTSNFPLVMDLIDIEGVKLCKEECYTLAQSSENPEILKAFLELDSSGVNAIHSDGDSLLMADIKYLGFRHTELLIRLGADVNFKNQAWYGGYTILNTLIRNYDKNTDFDKVKLIVESGAELNNENNWEKSALMEAASIALKNAHLELIQFLIQHGAKGGINLHGEQALDFLLYNLRPLKGLSDYARTKLVRGYFIPAVDLLIKAGDNLFNPTHLYHSSNSDGTPLSLAIYYKEKELAITLAKMGFEMIKNGYELQPENIHPVLSILKSLPQLMKSNDTLFSEISQILFNYQEVTNTFILSTETFFTKDCSLKYINCNSRTKMTFYSVPMMQKGSYKLSLRAILDWYQVLKENKIILCEEDRSSLLRIFLMNFLDDTEELPENFMEMVNYLIEILGVYTVSTQISIQEFWQFGFVRNRLQLPDCIYISAVYGKVELLKKLFPHWNQVPIAVLFCMCPWLQKDKKFHKLMLKSIVKILPLLMECGGRLSHGSYLYHLMKEYILCWRISNLKNLYNPEPLLNCLENYLGKRTPVRLEQLCRTVVRAQVFDGSNLLDDIKSLFSDTVLEDYVALSEGYNHTEFSWSEDFIKNLNFDQDSDVENFVEDDSDEDESDDDDFDVGSSDSEDPDSHLPFKSSMISHFRGSMMFSQNPFPTKRRRNRPRL